MSLYLTLDWASMDAPHPPDADALARAGVKIVILRRSHCYFDAHADAYRLAHDPVYLRDKAALEAVGIVVWDYMFPCFDAKAPSVNEQIGNYFSLGAPSDMTFLDVEFPRELAGTQLTGTQVVQKIEAYVRTFATKGVRLGIYSSHVQMHDSNELAGAGSKSKLLEETALWQKVPYPVGAGHPLGGGWRFPHETKPEDYWSVPAPWAKRSGWWVLQTQGDVHGIAGIAQADAGYFRSATKGDTGSHILWAKRRLQTLGDASGPLDVASDRFDNDMDRAVRALQRDNGLTQDGEIGPRTFAVLNAQK